MADLQDFSKLRGGEELLLRTVDVNGKIKIEEVKARGMRGNFLLIEECPGVSFSRKTGEINGPNSNPLPDSRPRLLFKDEAGLKLLAEFKAGTLWPAVSPELVKVCLAGDWLKKAPLDQVIEVLGQEVLEKVFYYSLNHKV